MAKKKLLLIDSSALIYRAFYALPPLTDKNNRIVNAVYGFFSAFVNIVGRTNPTHIIFTFDSPKPSFRKEKYKEYKAQREKAPDDLYAQIPLVKKSAESFNLPCLEQAGFEADDLIGSCAKKFLSENPSNEVVIATGDLDALQLINPRLTVFTLSRGISDAKIYDEKAVQERFGLDPHQMIDYKSLFGDTSDNIKGVKGIGQKTATDLLQKYHNLENLYQNLDQLTPRLKNILEAEKANAFLSKELVIIASDIPLSFDWDESIFKKESLQNGREHLLKEFSFHSLFERMGKMINPNNKENLAPLSQKESSPLSLTLLEKSDLENKSQFFENDTATDTFILWAGRSHWGEGLAFGPLHQGQLKEAFFIKEKDAEIKNIQFLKNKKIFCFDSQKIFREYPSLDFLTEEMEDLRLKAYLIHPPLLKKFSWKETVWHFLKYRFEEPKKQLSLLDQEADGYSSEKIKEILSLIQKLTEEIKSAFEEQIKYQKESSFNSSIFPQLEAPSSSIDLVFKNIEKPLSGVLSRMERRGIKIDLPLLEAMRKENADQLIELKKSIFELAGKEFNLDSPSQLADILFSRLNISAKEIKKGKAGHCSTAAEVLQKLEKAHPIIPFLLDYREKRKLQTTYLDALPLLVNQKTGRIHTSLDPTGTATGRLSSSNPNLQNIPLGESNHKEFVSIRKAFVAEKGFSFISLDYSQIEIRIIAYLTGEKELIKAFEKGIDIHQRTASLVKNIPLEKVTPEERKSAKALNFGIMYGISPFGFAKSSKLNEFEARIFIENYFKEFPKITEYIKDVKRFVADFGFVETIFGRRRYCPEARASNRFLRQAGERMAINMPIQGTAADIMKLALIQVDNYLKNNYPEKNGIEEARLILSIHDEIILEVKDELVDEISKHILSIMDSTVINILPLKTDLKVGKNWEEA